MLLTDIWKVPTWLSLLVIISVLAGAIGLRSSPRAARSPRNPTRHGNDQLDVPLHHAQVFLYRARPGRSTPRHRRCRGDHRTGRPCDRQRPRRRGIRRSHPGRAAKPLLRPFRRPPAPPAAGRPRRRHAPDAPAVGAPGTRACGLPCPTMRHVPHTRTAHRRTRCTRRLLLGAGLAAAARTCSGPRLPRWQRCSAHRRQRLCECRAPRRASVRHRPRGQRPRPLRPPAHQSLADRRLRRHDRWPTLAADGRRGGRKVTTTHTPTPGVRRRHRPGSVRAVPGRSRPAPARRRRPHSGGICARCPEPRTDRLRPTRSGRSSKPAERRPDRPIVLPPSTGNLGVAYVPVDFSDSLDAGPQLTPFPALSAVPRRSPRSFASCRTGSSR